MVKENVTRAAVLVIVLGFAIRLFCLQNTHIINPDGGLYIHQARAIYYGIYDSINTCRLGFLSSYPIFVAGAYVILKDWVIAAQSVSLLFGTMTLVPFYCLFRRFFDDRTSILLLLIFAIMPVFVTKSVDVIRGPVFWFFSVLGFYLFIEQVDKRKNFYIILSSLSLLMAAWARLEAVLFIIVSFLYLLVLEREKKYSKLVIFTIPIAVIIFFSILGWIIEANNLNIFQLSRLKSYPLYPFTGYENLRESLAVLKDQSLNGIPPFYVEWVRHLVWFIALGILMSVMVQTFFYPFFFVLLFGMPGIGGRIKNDRRIVYFVFSAVGAFVILYMKVLGLPAMSHRWVILFVLPSSIFVGFGLEKIISFFRSRFHLKESVAITIICSLILTLSLPKNLKSREVDKIVFKEIGQLIAEREGNDREILVMTSEHSIRWVSFYANADYKGAPCPQKNFDLENIVEGSCEEFVRNLREKKIRYFLWEEKHWPKESIFYLAGLNSNDFIEIGTWSHPDTGKLILFEVL